MADSDCGTGEVLLSVLDNAIGVTFAVSLHPTVLYLPLIFTESEKPGYLEMRYLKVRISAQPSKGYKVPCMNACRAFQGKVGRKQQCY